MPKINYWQLQKKGEQNGKSHKQKDALSFAYSNQQQKEAILS